MQYAPTFYIKSIKFKLVAINITGAILSINTDIMTQQYYPIVNNKNTTTILRDN